MPGKTLFVAASGTTRDAHAALHQKPRIGLLLLQHVACPLLVRVLVSGQSTRGWGQETQESRRLASTPPKASFDRASVRDIKFFVRGVVTRSLASTTGHPGKQHQRTGTRQTSFQDNDDNENRSEDSVRPQGLRDGRVDRWSQDPTAVNRSVETPARRVCRKERRLQGKSPMEIDGDGGSSSKEKKHALWSAPYCRGE